ncbi:MAG: ATP synthase F1 subunit delta [Bacteroidota bacterium]|nr:ATP synthase F1 subunit delta [Odoribacter sp.]MDP3642778.1 ATP synthase F1 subunit delta [Bacteroidota bacterium]
MDQSKINVRYAKAFFMLAKEKGLTTELRIDAGLIANVCSGSVDFNLMLESPIVKTSQKVKAIKSIFAGRVNNLSLDFLVLIAENNREKYIPGIFRNLEDLYRKEEGIKTAVITSSQPLDESVILQVKRILEVEFNAKIELSQKVKPELIGGFVLRVEDKQYDASVSAQLKKIKEKLLQTELK